MEASQIKYKLSVQKRKAVDVNLSKEWEANSQQQKRRNSCTGSCRISALGKTWYRRRYQHCKDDAVVEEWSLLVGVKVLRNVVSRPWSPALTLAGVLGGGSSHTHARTHAHAYTTALRRRAVLRAAKTPPPSAPLYLCSARVSRVSLLKMTGQPSCADYWKWICQDVLRTSIIGS